MPRIARIVACGYPHHIIQRGNNRQTVFFDDKDRLFYLELLKKYSHECSCKIHAYCLMNNHVHILFVPEYESSLAKTMQKLSLRYTQHINKEHKRTGRLWECRFHSAVVDKDAYLWSVCRYIERNPVRASLAKKPTEYKWSSASVDNKRNSFIESFWQDTKERKGYLNFLNQPDNKNEIGNIRKSTFSGKPIGAEEFINQMVREKEGDRIRKIGCVPNFKKKRQVPAAFFIYMAKRKILLFCLNLEKVRNQGYYISSLI